MVFRVGAGDAAAGTVVVAALGNGGVESLSGPFARFGFGAAGRDLPGQRRLRRWRCRRVQRPDPLRLPADHRRPGAGDAAGARDRRRRAPFAFLYLLDVVAVALLAQRRGAAVVGRRERRADGRGLGGRLSARCCRSCPGRAGCRGTSARDELALRLALNVGGAGARSACWRRSWRARRARPASGWRRHERYAGDLATLHEDIIRCLTSGLVTLDLDGRDHARSTRRRCEILGVTSARRCWASRSTSSCRSWRRCWPRPGRTAPLRRAEVTALRADGARAQPGRLGVAAGRPRRQRHRARDPLPGSDRAAAHGARGASAPSGWRASGGWRPASRTRSATRWPHLGIDRAARRATPGADADSRQLMDIVVREVDRLNGLITDLLDFARPRTEERRRLDLGEHEWPRSRGVRARAAREDHASPSSCRPAWSSRRRPGQLRQVVWNLMRNAAEAMPARRRDRGPPRRRRARARRWRSATAARASRKRSRDASSSRSSRPRRAAPAWAWRPSHASSTTTAARSTSRASPGKARPSRCGCRSGRAPGPLPRLRGRAGRGQALREARPAERQLSQGLPSPLALSRGGPQERVTR